MTNVVRPLVVVGLAFVAIIGALRWWATPIRERESAPLTSSAPSVAPEYALAMLDGAARDEMTLRRYKFLGETLAEKYGQPVSLVGDMSYVTKKQVEETGVKVSILEIMEGMNQAVSRRNQDKFAEVSACYVILRRQGFSHADAIESLRDLLRTRTSTELIAYVMRNAK